MYQGSEANQQVAYRLIEFKNGKPYTLFHGLPTDKSRRSREIPLDTWIKAEEKEVSYNKHSPTLICGFNVFLDLTKAVSYIERFQSSRNIVLVKIFVKNIRPKPRAVTDVWLASDMLLTTDNFEQALVV